MTPVLAFRFPPQRQFDNDCREQALSLFTNRLSMKSDKAISRQSSCCDAVHCQRRACASHSASPL